MGPPTPANRRQRRYITFVADLPPFVYRRLRGPVWSAERGRAPVVAARFARPALGSTGLFGSTRSRGLNLREDAG
jgi:hypothetical protein